MYYCFKVPMKQQPYKNACWLHAMATICCAGHDTLQQLNGEVETLTEKIDQKYGNGFVEQHTVSQGISAADFAMIYTQQEFNRISLERGRQLLSGEERFLEVSLTAFFNEFGPLVFVKPAEGQGFHALPIMGAAVNPHPKSLVTELLAVETMLGRAAFMPQDTFKTFLDGLEFQRFDESMRDVSGLWHYLPFHNNTQKIAKYSEEKIRIEIAGKIPFRAGYTSTPPSSHSSQQTLASGSDVSDSSDSVHESTKKSGCSVL